MRRKRQPKPSPKCSAVEGCTDGALILSYKLPDGSRRRICARHLARVRRTGKLGPAGKYPTGFGPERPVRKRKAEVSLLKLVGINGAVWKIHSGAHGSCYINKEYIHAKPYVVRNSTLHALARRGWIELGEWEENGTRSGRLTDAGRLVIRAPRT